MYEYRAKVVSVYDADTITANIDLGFRVMKFGIKLRLFGINAPEMRGAERPDGIKARDWLREQILNKDIIVKTHKDRKGKYGRWLAEIYPVNDNAKVSYNEMLVKKGMAIEKIY